MRLPVTSSAHRTVQPIARCLGVGVVHDEEGLQRDRHVVGRHIAPRSLRAGLRLERPQVRHERLAVVPGDLRAVSDPRRVRPTGHLRFEASIGRPEFLHRRDDVARLGKRHGVTPHTGDVGLDLPLALRADRRELVDRGPAERHLCALVRLPARREQGQQAHPEQRGEEPGPERDRFQFSSRRGALRTPGNGGATSPRSYRPCASSRASHSPTGSAPCPLFEPRPRMVAVRGANL